MPFTIDLENDIISISEPFTKQELDKIAKNNGLSKDYMVEPMSTDNLEGNGLFYYSIQLESGYWVHDVAN